MDELPFKRTAESWWSCSHKRLSHFFLITVVPNITDSSCAAVKGWIPPQKTVLHPSYTLWKQIRGSPQTPAGSCIFLEDLWSFIRNPAMLCKTSTSTYSRHRHTPRGQTCLRCSVLHSIHCIEMKAVARSQTYQDCELRRAMSGYQHVITLVNSRPRPGRPAWRTASLCKRSEWPQAHLSLPDRFK